jgi:hypothetical protein
MERDYDHEGLVVAIRLGHPGTDLIRTPRVNGSRILTPFRLLNFDPLYVS